jgi:hypothetical protein
VKKKRYILTIYLTELDESNRDKPHHLRMQMFYRCRTEGEARVMFDEVIRVLRDKNIALEHDFISHEVKL